MGKKRQEQPVVGRNTGMVSSLATGSSLADGDER
jgi:hypothetical protein